MPIVCLVLVVDLQMKPIRRVDLRCLKPFTEPLFEEMELFHNAIREVHRQRSDYSFIIHDIMISDKLIYNMTNSASDSSLGSLTLKEFRKAHI
jgi:hypothetical protein